ncbi:MAG: SIS domain-containing protein [Actinomycetia bacterium]|nr:SIS domain-containing protein [Actinomycetes bacterium]
MPDFDDSRLEDPAALAEVDPTLRHLAQAGARLRIESGQADFSQLADLADGYRPRAVIASGPESRLVRAVLEPCCPVPFVAWPSHALPAWVGALDLVLVLTDQTYAPEVSATVAEAARRGARVILACPAGSPVAEQAAGRETTIVATQTGDPTASAIIMLDGLSRTGLGPEIHPDRVAQALDEVAEQCSPHQDVASNPAKDLAIALADDLPLVWGGSVLAARASRRVAEALREASGRPALAADADDLVTLIQAAPRRDPFADPFDETQDSRCTTLVVLDDHRDSQAVARTRTPLLALAERHDVRVRTISHDQGHDVERYACLLQHGLFAATYLRLGLGPNLAR